MARDLSTVGILSLRISAIVDARFRLIADDVLA